MTGRSRSKGKVQSRPEWRQVIVPPKTAVPRDGDREDAMLSSRLLLPPPGGLSAD